MNGRLGKYLKKKYIKLMLLWRFIHEKVKNLININCKNKS